MGLRRVAPGENAPHEVNVIIEIPSRSDPVKYEVDKDTGTMFVDRFMSSSMLYPCDYGYIPQTLSEDNDPVDVLVVCPFPLISGSVVKCRPIGVLNMEDEQGHDSKIIAVPVKELTSMYDDVHQATDLPKISLDIIQHFFTHYKDLESHKWVKIHGWLGSNEAKQEVEESIRRYKK